MITWQEMLVKLYDEYSGRAGEYETVEYPAYDKNGKPCGTWKRTYVLVPIRHMTTGVDIETEISLNGDFIDARAVPSDERATVIPVTEDSNGRTSGVSPHLLTDKIEYLAGDVAEHWTPKPPPEGRAAKPKNVRDERHEQYLRQLKAAAEAPGAPESLMAVYRYLSKNCYIADLRSLHDPEIDDILGEDGQKFNMAAMSRFRVSGAEEPETWKDKKLFRFWQAYCDMMDMNEEDADGRPQKPVHSSISGELQTACRKSATGLLPGDSSKLFSSDHERSDDFTFRGRFNKAACINRRGRKDDQKVFSMLRYMMERSSYTYGDMTLVVWSEKYGPDTRWALGLRQLLRTFEAPGKEDGVPPVADQDPLDAGYAAWEAFLRRTDPGNVPADGKGDRILVLCVRKTVDAKKGRLALTQYGLFDESQYLKNIRDWHDKGSWPHARYTRDGLEYSFGMPGIREMTDLIYGKLDANGRLMPAGGGNALADRFQREIALCILFGRPVPAWAARAAIDRAAHPERFKDRMDHDRCLQLACSLIKLQNGAGYGAVPNREGGITMVDEGCTDRAYLYGRLMALSEWAERATFTRANDQNRRTTTGKWIPAVIRCPAENWKQFSYGPLLIYLNKNKRVGEREHYRSEIDRVNAKMSIEDAADNSPLGGTFRLGYSAQMEELRRRRRERKKEKAETA